jgi:hypothetical protein
VKRVVALFVLLSAGPAVADMSKDAARPARKAAPSWQVDARLFAVEKDAPSAAKSVPAPSPLSAKQK